MSERLTDLQLRILAEQWAPAADELIALRAENGRLREALSNIAKQLLIDEYAKEADPDTGDWEGAYEACVREARAALSGEILAEPHRNERDAHDRSARC